MPSKNSKIPVSLIAALYKQSIVLASNIKHSDTIDQPLEIEKTAGPLKYLGEHLKKVLVIVDDPNSVYLNEKDFILLTSIINACKLTIADIGLVNLAHQKTSLLQMLDTLPSKLVILFGVNASQIKLKLSPVLYKPTQLGETHLLFSNALSSMQDTGIEAKQEKAKLWNILKILFEL